MQKWLFDVVKAYFSRLWRVKSVTISSFYRENGRQFDIKIPPFGGSGIFAFISVIMKFSTQKMAELFS